MNRRNFTKAMLALGVAPALSTSRASAQSESTASAAEVFHLEPARKLPVRRFDVVVAGAGTAGVVAALAAARQGARTILVERKGYPGGTVTEGGTALHSYFNLWKAFPGVKKRQVVRGIPQEIIDRLARMGGTSGHAEMSAGYDYDSVCTAVDVELYKLATWEMLEEAGVYVCVNTLLVDAIRDGDRVKGVILESRAGREAIYAQSFIDCTAFGDLAAYAGAKFEEPNDHAVCNSIGLANVSLEKLHDFMKSRNAVSCMGQGQATGTAAALCARKQCGARDLKYAELRAALEKGGVYFET